MVRWTWERREEVSESLKGVFEQFPEWESSVAEIVNSFRCGYCTFKGKVDIVPEAYLKWIPVYYLCPRCGKIITYLPA